MLTLSDLKKKVVTNDLTLTKDEALDVPMIMNQKKGQVYDFDWENNTLWVSIWDITFKIK